MKHLLLALALAAPLGALAATDESIHEVGSLDQVVCRPAGEVPVLADDLEQVLFRANPNERVNVFQGWGTEAKSKVIDGAPLSFSKVEFLDREAGANIGYLPESLVQPSAACESYPKLAPVAALGGKGLKDPSCCRFPLGHAPKNNFSAGMAAFGSNRDGGARRHGAADLYRGKNDPIKAVTNGTVIRNTYFFYQGTYAIEVKHAGGFIVRYGEITSRSATRAGQSVSPGQTVGYMGKTTCCTPMLHFELYSGARSGPLSTRSGKFRRRTDLMNPTAYLRQWLRSTASASADGSGDGLGEAE